MQAIQSRARLVEPAAAAPVERPALPIRRAAAEEALRDGDGPVELTFDVVRVGGATEAISMILERADLERTLQSADGEELALVFDPDELERAIEGSEVEAQGLRNTAAVLTVAVAAMAGSAGVASAAGGASGTGYVVPAGGGAAIVNDISALRFDFYVADAVARAGAGLVLMHSRGTPATMHRLPPVAEIMQEVTHSLRASVKMAERRGVKRESIVIDPGIGFGKSQEQNLELIAKLDQLIAAFPDYPLLIGTSRKSFIGRILADESGKPAPADDRLHGTMATITAAILKGAHIIRVHDVKAAAETIRVTESIRENLRTM